MFDLVVAVVGGRQTLFVVKRSLRSAALPIGIEVRRRQLDAEMKAVYKKQRRPKAALLAARANPYSPMQYPN